MKYIIGHVLKPQGIRGEIKVEPVTPYPERFKDLDKIFIGDQDQITCRIEKARVSKGFVYLSYKTVLQQIGYPYYKCQFHHGTTRHTHKKSHI